MISKTKQRIHRIKNRIRTDRNIHIALYIIVALFFMIITYLTISSNIYKSTDYMQYKLKKCFEKSAHIENIAQEVTFVPSGNKIKVEYNFIQKCYSGMEVETAKDDNIVSLYFTPADMEEDCSCRTEFKGEIGPLEPGEYDIKIYKKNPQGEYLVDADRVSLS